MPLSVDNALGVYADALQLRARRAELLASNFANADTPHYKARDIDFQTALKQATGSQAPALKTTQVRHMQPSGGLGSPEALYRVPSQPSLDGNTVDSEMEKTAFAENAVRYQASLTFLSRKISGLMTALRGE